MLRPAPLPVVHPITLVDDPFAYKRLVSSFDRGTIRRSDLICPVWVSEFR